MAIPVEITNEVDTLITNPEIRTYYTNQEERQACEEKRQNQSWLSSLALAAFGLIQIENYLSVYRDVVKKRKELNDKIYNCALREHEHWRDNVHPHTLESFEYIYNLPEIEPDYSNPLTGTETQGIFEGALNYVNRLNESCDDCNDTCDNRLQAEYVLAQTGAATQLVRNQERRAAIRRQLKLQGMAATDRAGKNLGAPGRQALGVALNITNTLVAMSASGLNSGLATFGRGVTGLNNSLAAGGGSN